MTRTNDTVFVGVADHAGWAVLVTVSGEGSVLDRRRVELVDDALPKLPHHHEGQALPVEDAVDLVRKVRASAERHATACLDALASDVSGEVTGIALRRCPALPETVEERLADYRAQCVADTVMYRHALEHAAAARGWAVRWYDPREVFDEAAHVLRRQTIDDLLEATGATLGPPWRKDHRVAMAAAIAASGRAG